MVAKRSIMFELQTSLSADADDAFRQLEERVTRLQGMMRFNLAGGGRGARSVAPSSAGGSSASGGGQGGSAGITQALNSQLSAEEAYQRRRAARKREWDEQDRQRAERSNRLVEKANQESLDRQTADLKKAEAERQKILQGRINAGNRQLSSLVRSGGQAQQQDRRAAERDEARRIQLGNRQLSTLVRSGGQAQREDERRAQHDRELALARQREAYHRLGESIGSTTDAVTRLGEGMAYLGLIGQRDLGELTDSLLRIRGIANSITGGVEALRDVGGLVRNFREVHAAGGMAGVGRSLLGMAPASGAAAASIPVAAITAAAASVAAALTSAGLVIREGMAVGFGRGARVGGIVDRIATAEVGFGSRVFGAGLSLGGAAIDATSPYGLTDRERERRSEGYLSGFARNRFVRTAAEISIPFAGADVLDMALKGRQTERMQRFFEQDRAKRSQLDTSFTRGNEIENDNARRRMEARLLQLGVEYRVQEHLDPNSRAYQQIEARRRAHALHRGLFQEQRGLLFRERERLNLQINDAQQAPGSRDDAIRQREALEQRIIDMRQQEVQLAREQRQIDIDAARERLQSLQNQYQLEKRTAKGAVGRQQDFAIRFSQLMPIQQAALINAKRRLMFGENLTYEQRNALREHGDEQSQLALHDYELRLAGRQLATPQARAVGMGIMEQQALEHSRNQARETREEFAAAKDEAQGRLKGTKIGTTVDNKVTVDIQASGDLEEILQRQYDEALNIFLRDQNERIQRWIQEAANAAERRMAAMIKDIRTQGRVGAT